MSRVWAFLSSTRLTIWVLAFLLVLLWLNVALPQDALEGAERIKTLASASAFWKFVLVDLGLAHVPTSVPFLALLGLFFVNLSCVLAQRTGPVIRGLGRRPPVPGDLERWLDRPNGQAAPLPADWDPRHAHHAMKGFGYRPISVGPGMIWAVKHRSAPLGSLLFHSSFLLLALGGALLYYTRFDGRVRLAEGQAFDGRYQRIMRQPPLGGAPSMAFEVRRVEAATSAGEPVDLSVEFLLGEGRGQEVRTARINHPAAWGSVRLLIGEAGVAPVLWLQDAAGFTRDKVSVALPSRTGKPVEVPLDGGRLKAVMVFENEGGDFPGRDRLPSLVFKIALFEGDRSLHEGPVRRGQAVDLEGFHLLIPEIRYWASVQVVSEHGGGLLIAGFVMAVTGLCWRLLLHRRELVVAWDGGRLRMNGKGEYFGRAFNEEMEAVFQRLLDEGRGPASVPNGGGA